MNFSGSSCFEGKVEEGCRIMIGFEVFFCRIWYSFSPLQRIAYEGFDADDLMVRLATNISFKDRNIYQTLRGLRTLVDLQPLGRREAQEEVLAI